MAGLAREERWRRLYEEYYGRTESIAWRILLYYGVSDCYFSTKYYKQIYSKLLTLGSILSFKL